MDSLPVLLASLLCLPLASATFSFFLPRTEVSSLLGVSSRLYYVLDGETRPGALDRVISMATDNDRANFAWMAEEGTKLTYSIRVRTSDPESLRQPSLNVSHSGRIPQGREETWRVAVPCVFSGGEGQHGREEEAEVTVTVTVTVEVTVEEEGGVGEARTLNITREKVCPSSSSPAATSGVSTGQAGRSEDVGPPPHVVFAGLVAAVACAAAAAATAAALAHWRHPVATGEVDKSSLMTAPAAEQQHRLPEMQAEQQRQQLQLEQQQQLFQQQPPTQQQMFYDDGGQMMDHGLPPPLSSSPLPPPVLLPGPPPPPPPSNPPPPVLPSQLRQHRPDLRPAFFSDAESRVTDWVLSQQRNPQRRQQQHQELASLERPTPEAAMAALEVDRLRLKLGQLLQEGTFGRVYQGTLSGRDDKVGGEDEEERDVLIKTVVAGASQAQREMLVMEATALYGMSHSHLQTLVASTWDGTSPMLVYPYASGGNLKKWLQQGPPGGGAGGGGGPRSGPRAGLSTHVLVSLGIQLLKGIQHLHRRKIVHKDVAARNCLLGEGNHLRLCDSALSRDLFPSDYHCLGDNENRPIKWMPMEAIGRKKYSRASDVWSFGVFLWELMTRAQQPFSDVDPFEMESYLRGDYRLHQPNNCPDQLYSVLTGCWAARPAERASVHALYSQLAALQRQLQQFV